MWAFIGLLSLLGVFIFLVLSVVSLFKKRKKFKKNLMLSGGCFILAIAAASLDDTPLPADKEEVEADTVSVNKNDEKDDKEVTEEETEADKKEKQEKLAAEQARKEEEKKLAEEKAKKEEEERLAKEKAKKEEEKRLAEEKAKKEEEKKLAEEKAKKEEVADLKPTFNFTWDQFENNWATLVPEIKEVGLSSITVKEKVDQGKNKVVNAQINDYIMMMSDVDPKSNKVKYVMLMTEPSADNQSQNLNILLAFGNLIASSNPELTKDERGDILMNGLGFSGGSLENLDKEYDYKGIKYNASNMGGILTVSVKPVED